MKATRKLIPALAMLIVAAVVMSTASYAWFTMSKEVTATGMNVTVTAPNNLLISNEENGTYDVTADQTAPATAKVIPSSSADGLQFVSVQDGTPVNVATGGVKDETALVINPTSATNDVIGAYVDFKYWVKTEGQAVDVAVKDVKVTKGAGGTDEGLKAVRAAIINGGGTALAKADINTNVLYATSGTGSLTDLATANKDYLVDGKAIIKAKAAGTAIAEADRGTVNFASIGKTVDEGTIFTVPANDKIAITVRVWIEGESENCIVTKAASLDFNVELVLRDVKYSSAD